MNVIGLLLFVAAGGLLWARNMRYSVGLLALEGLLLALMVWTETPTTAATILVGVATLAIKGLLIPIVLWRILQTWPVSVRQDQPLPLWAYGAAAVVVLAVSHVIQLLSPTHLIRQPLLFYYGLASIHVGLVMIVARRHLLSQLAALVGIENGLVLLATALAGSLPTFMELGLLGDLALAVTLLVWTSHLIHQELHTTDVSVLQRLRG
jgi:hydrogenase-4 component E